MDSHPLHPPSIMTLRRFAETMPAKYLTDRPTDPSLTIDINGNVESASSLRSRHHLRHHSPSSQYTQPKHCSTALRTTRPYPCQQGTPNIVLPLFHAGHRPRFPIVALFLPSLAARAAANAHTTIASHTQLLLRPQASTSAAEAYA